MKPTPKDYVFGSLVGLTFASGVATLATGDVVYLGVSSFIGLAFTYVFWNEFDD